MYFSQPVASNGDGGADLALMVMEGEEETNRKHFNIKEIAEYENMTKSKRKRKMKKNQLKTIEDDFKVCALDKHHRHIIIVINIVIICL